MATAAIAGFKGKVAASSSVGGAVTVIAEVRDWSLTGEHAQLDATSKDSSGAREFISGLDQWSGSIEHLYAGDSATQKNLFDALFNKTTVDMEFYPQGTSSQFPIYSGSAVFTSWGLNSPNEDITTITADFQGSGTLTLSTN